jgi:hypothetical protein
LAVAFLRLTFRRAFLRAAILSPPSFYGITKPAADPFLRIGQCSPQASLGRNTPTYRFIPMQLDQTHVPISFQTEVSFQCLRRQ